MPSYWFTSDCTGRHTKVFTAVRVAKKEPLLLSGFKGFPGQNGKSPPVRSNPLTQRSAAPDPGAGDGVVWYFAARVEAWV